MGTPQESVDPAHCVLTVCPPCQPLTNLKHHFDSSKSDTKSKVIKSVPFGGGRWTVLFYAQSGIDQVSGTRGQLYFPQSFQLTLKPQFF